MARVEPLTRPSFYTKICITKKLPFDMFDYFLWLSNHFEACVYSYLQGSTFICLAPGEPRLILRLPTIVYA